MAKGYTVRFDESGWCVITANRDTRGQIISLLLSIKELLELAADAQAWEDAAEERAYERAWHNAICR